jgi:hypothetical protein
MSFDTLLSTIILVAFLVTIIIAIGSYAAYKLRENRRPRIEAWRGEGESAYFERIPADEPASKWDRTADD